jgi:ATP-dependent Zn protease
MLKVIRRGFFVLCLFFFAIICWKLLTASYNKQPPTPYASFLQALDAGKIQKTSIYMGYTLADLKFVGKDSSSAEVIGVSTKDLPNLIKKMLDDGVSVEFATVRRADSAEMSLDLVPMILLLAAAAYFYYSRTRKKA